jgi:Tol biopolymer transport system component
MPLSGRSEITLTLYPSLKPEKFNVRFKGLSVEMFRFVVLVSSSILGVYVLLVLVLLPLGRMLPSSGSITFGGSYRGSMDIFIVDVDRGALHRLTRQPGDERFGAWSPDGRQFVYTRRLPTREVDLVVSRLGSTQTIVFHPESDFTESPGFSSVGKQLALIVGRTVPDLFVYPLDQPSSSPLQLTDGPPREADPAWMPDGLHIVFASWMNGDGDIYQIGANGSNLVNLTGHPSEDASPALSPDGTQIAFYSLRSGARELYIMEANGENQRQLTAYDDIFNGDYWNPPIWSPDGKRVAITAVFEGIPEIVAIDIETGAAMRMTNSIGLDVPWVWLPDSQRLISASVVDSHLQLQVLDEAGNSRPLTTAVQPSWESASLWPLY